MKKTSLICFALLVATAGFAAVYELSTPRILLREPTTDQIDVSNQRSPADSPVIAGNSNLALEKQRIERILEYARRENTNRRDLDSAMEREAIKSALSLARKAGIPDIHRRGKTEDIQIEYWLVGGLYSALTKGIVFRRNDGVWSGIRIFENEKLRTLEKEAVKPPKSGWEQWELSATEIITPDKLRQMNPRPDGNDGDSFVIRVASGGDFAERFCFTPDLEDRSITRISELILKEFDW
jgi:hypothetical protein